MLNDVSFSPTLLMVTPVSPHFFQSITLALFSGVARAGQEVFQRNTVNLQQLMQVSL